MLIDNIQHSERDVVRSQAGVLWYPRSKSTADGITVELYDVRAADDLIVKYDFDRDGYSIARANFPDKEVSFISAWDPEQTFPQEAES